MVTIEAVNDIAKRAATVVLKHYHARDTWVRQKEDGSPVTGVDLAAEEIIREGVLALDDTIPYISEERALPEYEERRQWPRYWLVDPLDGTKEFINRTDEFTVNIAMIEGGEPVLGVVAAPASGLLFYATAGGGPGSRRESRHPDVYGRRWLTRPNHCGSSRADPTRALLLSRFWSRSRSRNG